MLAVLLGALGRPAADQKPAPPRMRDLPREAREEIDALYTASGGVADRQLRPGAWDLALADGVVVELDEEFHFTRYRAQTLDLKFVARLPWTSAYRGYCRRYEEASIAGGGRWSSKSTTVMFGSADAVGVFSHHGSPRGKQRAIYDSMKDAAAGHHGISLARISVYDEVGDVTLESVLRGRSPCDGDALLALIDSRTAGEIAL